MSRFRKLFCLVFLLNATAVVRADVVTDAAAKATVIVAGGGIPTPMGNRAMATVQTAVYEAVNAATKRYPSGKISLAAPAGVSVEAAVAAATRTVLLKFVPAKTEMIESDYRAALGSIKDGPAKDSGILLGEKAAEAVIASRADDNASGIETFRPITQAGVYVPTSIPVFSVWPKRKPWFMSSVDQFRPGPPPDLKSELWTRDYNEIKSLGVKQGSKRTQEQTLVASFWETTGLTVYMPVVLSVANAKDREITKNARLLAIVGQAVDDAIISVFDAKYAYNFWRPVTAIRNGDIDGNDATERDPSWVPFIETPMHPEYPCAHCIIASTIGTVLKAELGDTPVPTLSSVSPTAPGVTRRWTTIEDFVREVSEGRICDGVHYRNSTEVGTAMGKKIGELAFQSFPLR